MRKAKVLIGVLLAILIFGIFTGCGAEGKGVPDTIVFEQVRYQYETLSYYVLSPSYQISHNVDKTTHIDTVTVQMLARGEYGTETDTIYLQYQYNRASDLWTLIAEGEWEKELKLDQEALIGIWELEGDYCEYIYIDEVYENRALMGNKVIDITDKDNVKVLEYNPEMDTELIDNSFWTSLASVMLRSDDGTGHNVFYDVYIDITGVNKGSQGDYRRPFAKIE